MKTFDLRVDWTNVFGAPVDLGAFVTNLTDNVHETGIQTIYTTLGLHVGSLQCSADVRFLVEIPVR